MKNNKLGRVLNRSLFLALTLVFNVLAFAQPPVPPTPVETASGGAGGTGPGAPENVPIDMYEGLLLVVAVMFIIGMYYYNRRRKLA